MTAAGWLEAVAQRGGACRLDEHRRVCIRPSRVLTPELRAAFPALQVALVAALGARATDPAQTSPGATLEDVLAIFPGARVVADGQRALWPPPGGWLPTSARLDPYTATSPPVPCPTCASSEWHRAGDGWTCRRCHPPPGDAGQVEHAARTRRES